MKKTYENIYKKYLQKIMDYDKICSVKGDIAQSVRALASHARGRGFESLCLHHQDTRIRSVQFSPACVFYYA